MQRFYFFKKKGTILQRFIFYFLRHDIAKIKNKNKLKVGYCKDLRKSGYCRILQIFKKGRILPPAPQINKGRILQIFKKGRILHIAKIQEMYDIAKIKKAGYCKDF